MANQSDKPKVATKVVVHNPSLKMDNSVEASLSQSRAIKMS